MERQRFKPYKKESDYSYSFGLYPTIELLENRPDQVRQIILDSDKTASIGMRRIRELADLHNISVITDDRLIFRLTRDESVHAIGVFSKYATGLDQSSHV